MTFTIGVGVTCYAVPRGDWDRGELETSVLYVTKESLSFRSEHIVCGPQSPDSAGSWKPYALTGWYGFARGGTWVLLVRNENVTES